MTYKSADKDSIEPITNESFSKRIRGKLIKGSTATGTIPTIPSKYFTVVSDNSERKGFLKSSRRFSYDSADAPGPGSYENNDSNFNKEHGIQKNSKQTLSNTQLKNYIELYKNNTPGAGTYNIDNNIQKRNDFSRGFSRAFQKPIIDSKDAQSQKENSSPGPNQYDIEKSNKLKFRANNVCADAAFKSQSHRNIKLNKQHDLNPAPAPGPGSYNINENLKSAKVPFSSFKSSSKRISFTPKSLNDIPGPADYHPYEQVQQETIVRQIMPRRHYLAISAPAVPVAKELITPGPGAYNLRSTEDNEKKYMTSAVFVSCTSRWTSEANDQEIPGPTNYSPSKPLKQSFHYNYERKWV